jgi:hypothetical protein
MGSDENPVFTTSDTLMRNSTPPRYVYVNQSAKFDLADWDEDGDMDIISGDWFAFVNYFENITVAFHINEDPPQYPSEFSLYQNYPNPFNPSTTIRYTIPHKSPVNISIYNITGQHITTLVNELKGAGTYSVQWHSDGLISGVYFYRLEAGGFSAVKKCIILK